MLSSLGTEEAVSRKIGDLRVFIGEWSRATSRKEAELNTLRCMANKPLKADAVSDVSISKLEI